MEYNHVELEKVLLHYSANQSDSLKLKAAKFLIENMPGHYSYGGEVLDTYYFSVDSLFRIGAPCEQTNRQIDELAQNLQISRYAKIIEDVKTITAEYLIDNIDRAFDDWQNKEINEHVDFEHFCEYLLPYKAEELQPLDGWRTHLRSFHPDHLDELAYCDLYRNSALQAGIKLNDNLWYYMKPGITDETILLPVHRWRTRLRLPIGTCADYGAIATSVFRSQGIPVVMDFTPQWAFRSLGHSWNVLLAEDGRHIPFSGACSNPGQPHKLGERMPKVFRRTYAMNPELRRMLQTEEYVPDVFRNPFIRDVTEEYMDCRDAAIHVPEGKDGHYAFLTVFDNKEWVPVDFARMEDGKATFHKVGMNTVYLPVCYEEGGKMKPLAAPFLFAYGGKVRPVVADTARRADLVLWRKYPVLPHVQEVIMRIDSGEFQASNEARFKEKTVLHRVTDCSATGKEILLSDTVRPYRYWRFYQPKEGSYCTSPTSVFMKGEATNR